MSLIDVCVNLQNSQFDEDRNAVLRRAWANDVEALLLTATDLTSTRQLIEWAEPPHLKCTAGVHPHDAAAVEADWIDELADLAIHPAVCAIGETGLDFNRNFSPRPAQLDVFAAQIALAKRLDMPLFVHDRDSNGEVFRQLQAAGSLPPVLVHCFTGSASDLENYLGAGCFIGITGWVADRRRGQTLRELIARIPLDRLVLETDAPFLRPHNAPATFADEHGIAARFKRRNEPALLPYVCAAVAECYGLDPTEISNATRANACRLFGF